MGVGGGEAWQDSTSCPFLRWTQGGSLKGMMPAYFLKLHCSVTKMLSLIQARDTWGQRGKFFVSFQLGLVISGRVMGLGKLPFGTMTLQMSTSYSP